jgi:DNA-binding GntR family transcriptional regulator
LDPIYYIQIVSTTGTTPDDADDRGPDQNASMIEGRTGARRRSRAGPDCLGDRKPDRRGRVRFKTATEFAVSEIKKLIISQELPPGARIDQTRIAEKLDISRIPVRQALVQLAERSFVQIHAHRSAVVAPLSRADLEDLYGLRNVLENWALAEAFDEYCDRDREYLGGLIDSMEAAEQRRDVEEYMALNREFHLALFMPARNAHTIRILTNLFDLSERYQWMYLNARRQMDTSLDDHRQMVDAIASGACEKLLKSAKEHNLKTIEWISRDIPPED